MRRDSRPALRAGFTLIELLVSVAIVGLLASLILPALASSRETARLTGCRNNLRQVRLAHENFTDQHRTGVPYLHHPVAVSPFLERPELTATPRQGLRPDEWLSWDVWLCPSDGSAIAEAGHYSYLPSLGLGHRLSRMAAGPFTAGVITRLPSSDEARFLTAGEYVGGLTQTIVLSERLIDPVPFGIDAPNYRGDRHGTWFTAEASTEDLRTAYGVRQLCDATSDRGRFAQDLALRVGMRVVQVSSNGVTAVISGAAAVPQPRARATGRYRRADGHVLSPRADRSGLRRWTCCDGGRRRRHHRLARDEQRAAEPSGRVALAGDAVR